MIVECAPAKINLYLHIGPARADGLHALKSLFVFAEKGDKVTALPADALSLKIEGPFADALSRTAPEDNLIWKAARLLQREFGVAAGAAITLEKNLPVAAGLGGGSADAAAAMRALGRLWGVTADAARLAALSFELGADIPACFGRAPVLVGGAGEDLLPGPSLPPLWVCLVNPRVPLETAPIFRAFDAENPSPPPPQGPSLAGPTLEAVRRLFSESKNDLQPFAVALAPEIEAVLAFLGAAAGAIGARMSGSGVTCFALFAAEDAARRCARAARARDWWALSAKIDAGA